jgi:hypothetical protein
MTTTSLEPSAFIVFAASRTTTYGIHELTRDLAKNGKVLHLTVNEPWDTRRMNIYDLHRQKSVVCELTNKESAHNR